MEEHERLYFESQRCWRKADTAFYIGNPGFLVAAIVNIASLILDKPNIAIALVGWILMGLSVPFLIMQIYYGRKSLRLLKQARELIEQNIARL